jgi:hypothetical protein
MRLRLLSLVAVLGFPACAVPVNTFTSPSEVTVNTQLFSGTLPVGGSKFYSYSVNEGGTVSAMLASLSPGIGASPATRVELGIGVPAGFGCQLLTSAVVGAALVPQLQLSQLQGVYCVSITDTVGLQAPMTFAIRIIHP